MIFVIKNAKLRRFLRVVLPFVLMLLSYIFAYGQALQKESDETL